MRQTYKPKYIYGIHERCFIEWFKLTKPQGFVDLDPKNKSSSSGSLEIKKKKNTFFHGRYLKYSAQLNNQSYILKMQEDNFPDLPGIEYTCNRIAQILKLQIPPFYYLEFHKKPTFVTRNFMQDHVGTLDHIYKYLPEGKENHSCREIIKVILNQTGKLSDVKRFMEICLFDALIGNQDRHGRNLGIINTKKGKFLAPFYDNPSYFGIADNFILEADLNPSGTIWTLESKEPKVAEYIKEFTEIRLHSSIREFKYRLHISSSKIIREIKKSPINKKRKESFLKFIEKRSRSILNE